MGEFGCLGDECFQNLKVEGKMSVDNLAAEQKATLGSLDVIGVTNFADHVIVSADHNLTLTKGDLGLTEGSLGLTDGHLTLTAGNLSLTAGNATVNGAATVNGTLLGAPYLPTPVTIAHATLAVANQTLVSSNAAANEVNVPSGSIVLLLWTGAGDPRSIFLPVATKGYSFLLIIPQNIDGGAAKLTIEGPNAGTRLAQGSFIHTNHLSNNPVNRTIADAAGKVKIEIVGHADNGICGGGSTFRFHCLENDKWFVMADCQSDGDATEGELLFNN